MSCVVQKNTSRDDLPSGKRLRNYGKIHHVEWVIPL